MPVNRPCADCGTNVEYVSKECIEKALELEEDGGVPVSLQSIPLKRIRKEATERLKFRPLCNKCVQKEGYLIRDFLDW